MDKDMQFLLSETLPYKCPTCGKITRVSLKDTDIKLICSFCGTPFMINYVPSGDDEKFQNEVMKAIKESKHQNP